MTKLLTPFFAARLLLQLFISVSRVGLSLVPMEVWFGLLLVLTTVGSGQFIFDHLPHTQVEDIGTILNPDTTITNQEIDYYRQVSQLQPTHRDVLFNLSKLLDQQNDPTAEYLYNQAVEIDPLLEL